MELSDGSDMEDTVPTSQELDEDDLLGPSDEEDQDIDVSNVRGGRFSISDSAGSQHNNKAQLLDPEEEFLDLALGDEGDGLEFDPEEMPLAAIKLRARPHTTETKNQLEISQPLTKSEESEENQESEEQEPDSSETKDEVIEEDEDEAKGERARFVSERPLSAGRHESSSVATFMDNPQPIRTLGDHLRFGNQFHYSGHRMRGNMRPRGMSQNLMNPMRRGGFRGSHPHRMTNLRPTQVQINRPDFRPPGPEISVSQCSGQIFIDFNQPMQQGEIIPQPRPISQPRRLPAPPTPRTPLRQGVGIVRPQIHQNHSQQPRLPPRPLPPIQRLNQELPRLKQRISSEDKERENPFFPPPQPLEPPIVHRTQFPPLHHQFPPQQIQMRPPVFMPSHPPPLFIPQPNFQTCPPPMNFGIPRGPPPGMMMMDYNRPTIWMEQQGFCAPPHHFSTHINQPYYPPQITTFPPETIYPPQQSLMMSYGRDQQVPGPSIPPMEEPRREYDYSYRQGYRRKRPQEDESRTTPKQHRYEHPTPSTSSSSSTTNEDRKAQELVKIIVETKKEMGIDEEYMAKMEAQKRLREEILRRKGRKKGDGEEKKNSIHLNPAALKGDLSLLNAHLQIQMDGKGRGRAEKPKTILRVTKNSKGEVIHMEKLLKVTHPPQTLSTQPLHLQYNLT